MKIEMSDPLLQRVRPALLKFIEWLGRFGEYSQDQYDFWASRYGQLAKSLYYRKPLLGILPVFPLVFMDSFFPSLRSLFRQPTRFPIADAHFAMGFTHLYQATGNENYYQRAVGFLEALLASRCPGYEHFCWGYPFDWMTHQGMIPRGTPLITTTPYVYDAFYTLYTVDHQSKWLEVLHSIAEHAAGDYHDRPLSSHSKACSYIARDKLKNLDYLPVVNANAYRACMLFHSARLFQHEPYRQIARGNLNFVLNHQQPDGSWFYAVGEQDQFVDHFHTCFVLKNLIRIEELTGDEGCQRAIHRGLGFYRQHLFDAQGLPVPFAKRQRLNPYHRDIYDYAECINLGILVRAQREAAADFYQKPLQHLLDIWQKPDGSFYTRQLWLGWNRVPYHRWAQSQTFRSLSLLLATSDPSPSAEPQS